MQEALDRMTVAEAEQYLHEGIHFAAGSMAPKIEAAIAFIRGRRSRSRHHQPGQHRARNGRQDRHSYRSHHRRAR